jgi:hypothetical protein
VTLWIPPNASSAFPTTAGPRKPVAGDGVDGKGSAAARGIGGGDHASGKRTNVGKAGDLQQDQERQYDPDRPPLVAASAKQTTTEPRHV